MHGLSIIVPFALFLISCLPNRFQVQSSYLPRSKEYCEPFVRTKLIEFTEKLRDANYSVDFVLQTYPSSFTTFNPISLSKRGDRLFVSLKSRDRVHHSVIFNGTSHTKTYSKSDRVDSREVFPLWNEEWFDWLLTQIPLGSIEKKEILNLYPMAVLTLANLPIRVTYQVHLMNDVDHKFYLHSVVFPHFKLHHFRFSFHRTLDDQTFNIEPLFEQHEIKAEPFYNYLVQL